MQVHTKITIGVEILIYELIIYCSFLHYKFLLGTIIGRMCKNDKIFYLFSIKKNHKVLIYLDIWFKFEKIKYFFHKTQKKRNIILRSSKILI